MEQDDAWLGRALAVGIPVSLVMWVLIIIAVHSGWRWLHAVHHH